MNLTRKGNDKLNLSISIKREFPDTELNKVLSGIIVEVEDDLARLSRLFKSEGLEKGRMIHVGGGSFGTRVARTPKVPETESQEGGEA